MMVNIQLHAIHERSKAERNYFQLNKEDLAALFGLGKSYKFIHGRYVKIVTDHKHLVRLFVEHKHIPVIISPQI